MDISAEIGGAGVWVWEVFGKKITDKALGEIKDRWAKFNWKQASQNYREQIKNIYSSTRILNVSKPISIDNIYTDLFILEKPKAWRHVEIKYFYYPTPQRRLASSRRISALRMITKSDKLYIFGKPGSGKTTFLKHISLLAANEKIDAIPIFISCGELNFSKKELFEYIENQFDICSFPKARSFIEYILSNGRAIILLDGLDEVKKEGEQRKRIINYIVEFIKKYPNNKYVITCRSAASEYVFEDFDYVEIADFSDTQIEAFVNNWFQANEQIKQDFFRDIRRSGYYDLAVNPLLLTLLCTIYEESHDFPKRKNQIYQEAINLLLKKWDNARNITRDTVYKSLTLNNKRNLLKRIAFETFLESRHVFYQEDIETIIDAFFVNLTHYDFDNPHQPARNYLTNKNNDTSLPIFLSEHIDTELVLKTIESQHGILSEIADHIYSFAHASFQEFLVASYINRNGITARWLSKYINDGQWHNVIVFLAGFSSVWRPAIDYALINWMETNHKLSKLTFSVNWLLHDLHGYYDGKQFQGEWNSSYYEDFLNMPNFYTLTVVLQLNLDIARELSELSYRLELNEHSYNFNEIADKYPFLQMVFDLEFYDDVQESFKIALQIVKTLRASDGTHYLPYKGFPSGFWKFYDIPMPPSSPEDLLSFIIKQIAGNSDIAHSLLNKYQARELRNYLEYMVFLYSECLKSSRNYPII